MKKSQKQRDSYLLRSPPDELVCFFYSMSATEFFQYFSADTIGKCFRNVPADRLLVLCENVPPSWLDRCMTKSDFKTKWYSYRLDYLAYDLRSQSDTMFTLVNQGYLTYDELYVPFQQMTMTDLSLLYSVHSQWKIMLRPLFTSIHRWLHYVPHEMVEHILSFLFYTKK